MPLGAKGKRAACQDKAMDREQVRETDSGGSRQHSSRAGAGRIPEEAEAVLQYASREGAAEAGLGLAAGPALPYGPGLAPPAAEADCWALAPGAATRPGRGGAGR